MPPIRFPAACTRSLRCAGLKSRVGMKVTGFFFTYVGSYPNRWQVASSKSSLTCGRVARLKLFACRHFRISMHASANGLIDLKRLTTLPPLSFCSYIHPPGGRVLVFLRLMVSDVRSCCFGFTADYCMRQSRMDLVTGFSRIEIEAAALLPRSTNALPDEFFYLHRCP